MKKSLISQIESTENHLKIFNTMLGNAQSKYLRLKELDDGTHKNHWKEIEFARKEVDSIRKHKNHLVSKITKLEKELEIQIKNQSFHSNNHTH